MKKRSVKIAGHATSITMEEPFWIILKELADSQKKSLGALISEIDARRGENNLSSALRVYILEQVSGRGSRPG